MQESVKTHVVINENGDEGILEIELQDNDCVSVYLDGKELFGADWTGNMALVFKRALELWKIDT